MPTPTVLDATLETVIFDWPTRTVTILLGGPPANPSRCSLTFMAVRDLIIPSKHPWGSSVSILALHDRGRGRFELELQSGDVIRIEGADLDPVLREGLVDRRGNGNH